MGYSNCYTIVMIVFLASLFTILFFLRPVYLLALSLRQSRVRKCNLACARLMAPRQQLQTYSRVSVPMPLTKAQLRAPATTNQTLYSAIDPSSVYSCYVSSLFVLFLLLSLLLLVCLSYYLLCDLLIALYL